MTPTVTQVGGEHYAADYQHWDFATESGLPFLLAVCTKYLFRAHKKHGLLDAQKAMSFVEKWEEHGVHHWHNERMALPKTVVLRMLELGMLQIGAPEHAIRAAKAVVLLAYTPHSRASYRVEEAKHEVQNYIKELEEQSANVKSIQCAGAESFAGDQR